MAEPRTVSRTLANVWRNCVLPFLPVPAKQVSVSFIDPGGIRHSVEVEAETLFEAAALGISRLKKDGWTGALGPGTRLDIEVREPSVRHSVTVLQVRRWAEAGPASPKETLRKRAAREIIGE